MNSIFSSSNNNASSSSSSLNLLENISKFFVTMSSSSKSNQRCSRLIIPSLASSDTDFHSGAVEVLSCLRKEVSVWCHPDNNNDQHIISSSTSKSTDSVFWSLILAHTSSFEHKHHDPFVSWFVSLIAVFILKFEQEHHHHHGARRLRAAVQDILSKLNQWSNSISFAQNILLDEAEEDEETAVNGNNKLSTSSNKFKCEQIGPDPKRWIGVARNFLHENNNSNNDGNGYCSSSLHETEMWQLSTTIVQSLLSVWVQNRGIFIDRIKVNVVCQSQVSVGLSSKLIKGVQFPFQFGIESKIVLKKKLFSKMKTNKKDKEDDADVQDQIFTTNVICFSCSLEDLEPNTEEKLLTDFCERHQIGLIICQRLISPQLKVRLAKSNQRTMTMDRLGIGHFPTVVSALQNIPVIHRFESDMFVEKNDDHNFSIKKKCKIFLMNNEGSSSSSRIMMSDEEKFSQRWWISNDDDDRNVKDEKSKQQPSVSTLLVSLNRELFHPDDRASIETAVKNCLQYCAQILVDDVVVSHRGCYPNRKISSLDLVVHTFSILLKNHRHQISNCKDQNYTTVELLQYLVREMKKMKMKGVDEEEQEHDGHNIENQNSLSFVVPSPCCMRVGVIKDVVQVGLELVSSMLSIAKVV